MNFFLFLFFSRKNKKKRKSNFILFIVNTRKKIQQMSLNAEELEAESVDLGGKIFDGAQGLTGSICDKIAGCAVAVPEGMRKYVESLVRKKDLLDDDCKAFEREISRVGSENCDMMKPLIDGTSQQEVGKDGFFVEFTAIMLTKALYHFSRKWKPLLLKSSGLLCRLLRSNPCVTR